MRLGDWISLLYLACKSREHGVVLLPDDEIAYALDLTDSEWESLLAKFVEQRMVARRDKDDALVILNWKVRQYDKPSDTPSAIAQRKREQRTRKRVAATEEEDTSAPPSRQAGRTDSRTIVTPQIR